MRDTENTPSGVITTTASGNGTASSASVNNVDRSRRAGPTGPRTARGKEKSKRNSIKHGIFSQAALLKGESRAEFDALWNNLRDDFQPEGILEEALVEKLALLVWRQRRLIGAEIAEIQKSNEFQSWDEVARQADGATEVSEYGIGHEGGLIRRIANAEVLERCLELLKELKEGIHRYGFDAQSDSQILTMVYGEASSEKQTVFNSYCACHKAAQMSEEERQKREYAEPDECMEGFLVDLGREITKLERYKKARSSMETEGTRLESVSQQAPLIPQFDHLVRYEASLERSFDRTLTQLERLQRMRLGKPVPPKIEVHHSLS